MSTKIALVACGSFNPITYMHLRMMERAKDHVLKNMKGTQLVGGYFSPVSDGYGKPGLLNSSHRLKMCQMALNSVSNQWIKVIDWELQQKLWTPTIQVLKKTQEIISMDLQSQVKTMLVCGSDFLATFGKEGLWLPEDVEDILTSHGLLVITRPGHDANNFIESNQLVNGLKQHIHVVPELVMNDLSSTVIRSAVKNRDSVKYLVPDPVIGYIEEHGLYLQGAQNPDSVLAPYARNKEREDG